MRHTPAVETGNSYKSARHAPRAHCAKWLCYKFNLARIAGDIAGEARDSGGERHSIFALFFVKKSEVTCVLWKNF